MITGGVEKLLPASGSFWTEFSLKSTLPCRDSGLLEPQISLPSPPDMNAADHDSLPSDAEPATNPEVDLAHQPPHSIAPTPQMSSRQLFVALGAVCLFPLVTLSLYAIWYGKATEHTLPVEITIDRRPIPTAGGSPARLQDVLVVKNIAPFKIPNLTMNINGQYFLYQGRPLAVGETLVVRQAAFMTKSNQSWAPGRYPITEITVTGRLPSGARGVTEVTYSGQADD